jgi:hypothetical protein
MATKQHRHAKRRAAGLQTGPAPALAPPSRIEAISWAGAFLVVVVAMLWNHHQLFFLSWTDEQIHFYVGRRLAEGAVLYRDIESSRPPLVLFPLAVLIKVGVAPLLAGRSLVLVSQVATAALLGWAGWRLTSWRAGALGALLFLSSPEVFDRIHYTGIHLVALTSASCVFLHLRRKVFSAGLLFGLTLATDQHGIVICGVVALSTALRRPRDGGRFIAGAAIPPLIVFGTAWALGGRHMWSSLLGNHLYHFTGGQSGTGSLWQTLLPWLCEHAYLIFGAALAVAICGPRRRSGAADTERETVRLLCLVIVAHVVVVVSMTEAIFLHVVVIAPLMSLLAGMGFEAAFTWWRQQQRTGGSAARRSSRQMVAGSTAVLGLVVFGWAAARSYREHLDEQQYSFWPYVLHAELARAQRLDVAQLVAKELALPGTATLFGDPTVVSAVALDSGLRVSADLADVDARWLDAGTVTSSDIISRIESDHVGAIVTSPWAITQRPDFRDYIISCYEIPKVYDPPDDGPGSDVFPILVYRHKSDLPFCGVAPSTRPQ